MGDGEGPEGGRRSPGSSPESAHPSGRASRCQEDRPKQGSHANTRTRGHARALKQKLRDLDPHINISETVPTQRLHSNWPDGQRRQLARHFYGLTPAQILEEEEKERLREQGVQRKKDPTAEEGDAAGD